jgi:hypothetical protein
VGMGRRSSSSAAGATRRRVSRNRAVYPAMTGVNPGRQATRSGSRLQRRCPQADAESCLRVGGVGGDRPEPMRIGARMDPPPMPWMPPTQPTTAAIGTRGKSAAVPLRLAAVRRTTRLVPRGIRTTAIIASMASGPGDSSTRMTEPMTTPGRVPMSSWRVRVPPVCPWRQSRSRAPGVATTL